MAERYVLLVCDKMRKIVTFSNALGRKVKRHLLSVSDSRPGREYEGVNTASLVASHKQAPGNPGEEKMLLIFAHLLHIRPFGLLRELQAERIPHVAERNLPEHPLGNKE